MRRREGAEEQWRGGSAIAKPSSHRPVHASTRPHLVEPHVLVVSDLVGRLVQRQAREHRDLNVCARHHKQAQHGGVLKLIWVGAACVGRVWGRRSVSFERRSERMSGRGESESKAAHGSHYSQC